MQDLWTEIHQQVVKRFLNNLTEAQRLLLAECDRLPYYSVQESAIVLECSKPWLPLAIKQQDGIIEAASSMGIGIKVFQDPKKGGRWLR